MSTNIESLLRILGVDTAPGSHLVFAAVLGLVIIWFRRCFVKEAELLATGLARRMKYPAAHGHHPKPSINWQHSASLKFETGFVFLDGLSVWWQSFRPSEKKARGVLVMYHGYGDHSDYIHHEQAHEIALHSDMIVIAFDQPGFGRSDGLWAYIPDWDNHVELCVTATKQILSEFVRGSNLPVFAYGHSMGGGVCISASISEPKLFRGMILSAPMVGISKSLRRNKYVEQFFIWLAGMFPTLPLAPVPDLGHLCFEDPEFYRRVKETDHLNYPGHVRLGTAKSLLIAQNWIAENMKQVEVPFLVLHGDTDLVTALDGSHRLYNLASSTDKQIEVLQGYYHSSWGPGVEQTRSEYARKRITQWLIDRCQKNEV